MVVIFLSILTAIFPAEPGLAVFINNNVTIISRVP